MLQFVGGLSYWPLTRNNKPTEGKQMSQSADQKNATAVFTLHRVSYDNLGSRATANLYCDDSTDAKRLLLILVPTACNITVERGTSTLTTRTGA